MEGFQGFRAAAAPEFWRFPGLERGDWLAAKRLPSIMYALLQGQQECDLLAAGSDVRKRLAASLRRCACQ